MEPDKRIDLVRKALDGVDRREIASDLLAAFAAAPKAEREWGSPEWEDAIELVIWIADRLVTRLDQFKRNSARGPDQIAVERLAALDAAGEARYDKAVLAVRNALQSLAQIERTISERMPVRQHGYDSYAGFWETKQAGVRSSLRVAEDWLNQVEGVRELKE